MIYVDIKRFRAINNTFGFLEGDDILRALAEILQESLVRGECCARVSADQFVLLLHYNSWEETINRTRQTDIKLNEWVSSRGKRYNLHMIFGVYKVSSKNHEDISLMLDFASYAKRNATETHKSVAVLYDEQMRKKESWQRELADRVQTALEQDEFVVYYQPKVNMPTGKIVGSEALVRWEYPGKGILPPGAFIPYFEKNGFVVEIDLYIYEQVCKAIRRWIDEGYAIYPVSCNFSRLHFKNKEFPQKLAEIANKYGISHQLLELEVTESAFVENVEQVLEHFSKLRDMGFLVSIDDFGAGYSSLGLLQQFTEDIIKLDRSFIQQGMKGKKDQAIIRGVIQMVQTLEMKIICEGVEERDQAEMLMDMGCYTAQGYYYAKPMWQKAFEEKLKDASRKNQAEVATNERNKGAEDVV